MTNSNRPRFTGRSLVLLREDAVAEGLQILADTVGTRSADSITGYESIGVAVVDAPPEQISTNTRAIDDSPILFVEPERYVYPIVDVPTARNVKPQADFDESQATWGLQVTGVADLDTSISGIGIKVAVLDTGLDLTHPDFQNRKIVSKSFVEYDVQDVDGHGTHCAGTACGSLNPSESPRYGIAYDAELYVSKIFPNKKDPSYTDSGLIQAMEWAIASGCQIISMSVGADFQPGDTYSRVYEAVARRALNRGTLIIAAAGNESDRSQGNIVPVGSPANCPSIMAVGAIDSDLQIYEFSCGGINPEGGEINIAAPGVNVYSSIPMPDNYDNMSGTSMATPHVAGIAALYAQVTGLRGQELWNVIIQNARDINLPQRDVGAGLVQAPSQQ
ncbi:S8 family peptidase [Rivularia sp. UHCC 0363]|uniref:S8 family peptidase n=1 Tax=Rivularia sp. UHCC 0363 TaxID=3110244 RepID=UPI002B209BA0|nr:S8 family serine peptidase [Rivularia sp. UHCC 0363]MEA5595442.1 S8 family serine peptidase [Rivularia sp. UHCC 0363]